MSPEELEAFTRKSERAQKRYDSQAKVLDAMGIPFLRRPDQTLIVYRLNARTPEKTQKPAPTVLP